MKPHTLPHRTHPECGGVTILTVLGLLVLATVLGFGLARGTIRELAITGTIWQSAKASEASEAGLDWFLLWSNKENRTSATGAKRDVLVTALQNLNTDGAWQENPYIYDSSISTPADRWDRAAKVVSTETETNDMVFANTGTDFKQKTTIRQSFDIMFRYLGDPGVPSMSSGTGSPAGTATPRTGRDFNLYQVRSTGKASIDTGNGFMRYLANREMFVTAAP